MDCKELTHFDPKLAYLLLHNPALLLPLFDEAAVVAQQRAAKSELLVASVLDRFQSGIGNDATSHWLGSTGPQTATEVKEFLSNSVKTLVHVRLAIGLPPVYDHEKPCIGALRSSDTGKLVQIRGTIVRTSKLRPLEHSKTLECGKCGETFTVFADLEQGDVFAFPTNAQTSSLHSLLAEARRPR